MIEWRVDRDHPKSRIWTLFRPNGTPFMTATAHEEEWSRYPNKRELEEIAAALNEREALRARVAELEEEVDLLAGHIRDTAGHEALDELLTEGQLDFPQKIGLREGFEP